MKRRGFLLSALGATGALVVGWGVMPPRARVGSPALWPPTQGEVALNGWIKITPQGDVVLAMPRSEMGQGIFTGLSMLAAEELDVPMERVRLEPAGHDALYGNVAMLTAALPFHPLDSEGPAKPAKVRLGEWMVGKIARELGINATGGSSSMADAWDAVRMAAASARAALLNAASLQWQLPLAALQVQAGRVTGPAGQQAHYTANWWRKRPVCHRGRRSCPRPQRNGA